MKQSTRKYLEEVWGYTKVEDIDPLTIEAIRENAVDMFPADSEIMMEYLEARVRALSKAAVKAVIPLEVIRACANDGAKEVHLLPDIMMDVLEGIVAVRSEVVKATVNHVKRSKT